MKIVSLRARLIGWIALLLVFLLTGFGLTSYQWIRRDRLSRIDEGLGQRTAALASDLRFPALRFGRNLAEGLQRWSVIAGRLPQLSGNAVPSDDTPPPLPVPPPEEPEPGKPAEAMTGRQFRLTRLTEHLFEKSEGEEPYYYAIWWPADELWQKSAVVPDGLTRPPTPRNENRPVITTRGEFRECAWLTDRGELVLAGVSLATYKHDLRRFAWWLGGAGLGVLVLGIGGGWMVAGRAMRPISEIGDAARRISAGNLTERIPAANPADELGQLAGILNSTFARLESAFAKQRQFTDDASHEMRTPLAVIITEAQAALARPRSKEEYQAALETCLEAAQDLRRLTESLLSLARLDAGEVCPTEPGTDIADTVASCIALVRPLAEAKRLQLEGTLDSALLPISPARLRQVTVNLLDNAIHYNYEGGTVRVATRRDGKFVLLVVADTGRGIAAEHLPHLFNRFYRADPARTQTGNRFGLGLAIVKAIVDAHGGQLSVESELGLGTTFTVRFPA